MKDNDNVLMGRVDLSNNMVEHVVHQMQLDLELSKIKDVRYHIEFKEKLMKDDTGDKEDISNILSFIVVTKSPSHKITG